MASAPLGTSPVHRDDEIVVDGDACIAQGRGVSPLNLYRQALRWRRKLQAAESFEWIPGTRGQVVHFGRPGGWRSVTNFGTDPVPLPRGTVILASARLDGGQLPHDTTAWLLLPGGKPLANAAGT